MKKVLLFIVIILAAFGIYWVIGKKDKPRKNDDVKQGPISLQIHSGTFNTSIANAMGAYHSVKNAFVDADTARAKNGTREFIALLDSIPLMELKNDSAMIFETASATLADVKSNAESLLAQTNITEMRKDFSAVTDQLYPAFFKSINYEGEKLYLQYCPMAFDGDKGANWISNNVEIVNPYLGKNHPKYKGTMLHCGELMDTIKTQ